MSWRLAAAWVVVLAVTTGLTWQIVSVADSQVRARPVDLVGDSGAASSTSTTRVSTTSSPSTSSTSVPAQTSTSTGPGTSTSQGATDTTTGWAVRTITTPGGNVIISYRPGAVMLQTATPTPGFAVEVHQSGPDRVRVEFESDQDDIRVEVEWEDGALDVAITG